MSTRSMKQSKMAGEGLEGDGEEEEGETVCLPCGEPEAEASQCQYHCCRTTCLCAETSRAFNVKWLVGTAALYIAFSIILLAVSSSSLATLPDEVSYIFDDVKESVVAILCFSVLLFCCGVWGVTATLLASKVNVVIFLFLSAVVCLLISGFSIALYVATVDGYVTSEFGAVYLSNWEDLASQAKTDPRKFAWFQQLFVSGDCCGWSSATDQSQNPAYLDCPTPFSQTCSTHFEQLSSSRLTSLSEVGIAFSVVQIVLLSASCALVCRSKKRYQAVVYGYGDYYVEEPSRR